MWCSLRAKLREIILLDRRSLDHMRDPRRLSLPGGRASVRLAHLTPCGAQAVVSAECSRRPRAS